MKFKKLLLISALGFLSMISCFAAEISIKSPYVVTVKGEASYESRRSSFKDSFDWPSVRNLKCYPKRADYIKFELSFNFGGQKLVLAPRVYAAAAENRSKSAYFEEFFLAHGRRGKIIYKVDVEYGVRGRKHEIIESLKIEVLHASLGGIELCRY